MTAYVGQVYIYVCEKRDKINTRKLATDLHVQADKCSSNNDRNSHIN
jgi:hypothetical protein